MFDDNRLAPLRSWCEDRELRLAVLFGSVARGRQHEGSDVDLALWPADVGPPRRKLTWLAELARLLGRETSLVFVTPRLDPVLGMEIVRHGRVVHEAEPGQWLAERSRLWHLYNDALPFRKALEDRLAATARELRGA